jgi:uncharacterized membrane protein YbhN (UPF0104 family)
LTSLRKRAARFAGRLADAGRWLEERPLTIIVAAAAITIGVMFMLASRAGWERLSHLAARPHAWAWLGLCFAGELVAYGGYVLTIRGMAKAGAGNEMTLGECVQTVVAGFGVFAATRASGGFAVDYWAFQRAGATKKEAAAQTAGLGLLEYVVLSVGALFASIALFLRADGHASAGTTLPSLLIIPCLAAGFVLTSRKRARRLSKGSGGYVRRWFAGLVAGAITVRKLLASPREHGLGLAGNVAYWAGDILCLWAALQVVGLQISVSALVLAYSGAYVLTRRSLPAGGAGVVEVALTFALFWMGLEFAPALVAVVIYRLFNFWLPIVPALLVTPAVKEMRERFQQVEQPA